MKTRKILATTATLIVVSVVIASAATGIQITNQTGAAEMQSPSDSPNTTKNSTSLFKTIHTSPPQKQLELPDGGHETSQYQQLEELLGLFDTIIKAFGVFKYIPVMWTNLLDQLQHPFSLILKFLRLFEVPLPKDVSMLCQKHVRFFFSELLDTIIEHRNPMNEWSVQMLDAQSKLPPGILRGTLVWPGSFQQCTNILVKDRRASGTDQNDGFKGEHCLLHVRVPHDLRPDSPTNFSLAMCFPNTCGIEDKQKLINYVTSPFNLEVITEERLCHTNTESSMDTTAMVISFVLLIPISAVLAATVLEMWKQPRNHRTQNGRLVEQFVSSFSYMKGWNRLFSKPPAAMRDFSFIQGMRCLSIAWIVYGHSYTTFPEDSPWREIKGIIDNLQSIHIFPFLTGGFFAVDTFFFLSGFCSVYFFLKLKQKSHTSVTEILLMYPKRYLRLTPSFAYVVAFVAGPWMYLGNGPFWSVVGSDAKNCRAVWWTNMLYISNLNLGPNKDTQCQPVTWYLMADMQLFMIAPPLLLLLVRKPRYAVWLMTTIYFGLIAIRSYHTTTANFVETYLTEYTLEYLMLLNSQKISYVNRAAWNRGAVYVLGMLLGHYMHKINQTGIRMKSHMVAAGWTACVAATTALTYIPFPFGIGLTVAPYAVQFLWCELASSVWCMSVAWIIFACATGHGGIVTKILSCQPLVVLGRLSYGIYLIHIVVQLTILGLAQTPRQPDTVSQIGFAVNMFVYSVGASIILYLLIESPLSAIKLDRKTKATAPVVDQDNKDYENRLMKIADREDETKSLLLDGTD